MKFIIIIVVIVFFIILSEKKKRCSKCNRKIGLFEDCFNGMCKNCYSLETERKNKEKAHRKEMMYIEEKRKTNEIYEKLEENIISNIYTVYLYDFLFKLDVSSLELKLKSEYDTSYKLIKYIFKQAVYRLNNKSNYSLRDILRIFKNIEFFRSIYKECISSNLKIEGDGNSEAFTINMLKEIINDKCIEAEFHNTLENYQKQEQLIGLDNENVFTALKVDKSFRSENLFLQEQFLIRNLGVFYYYACFLLYIQKFYDNIGLLNENKEFYKMITKLKEKSDMDYVVDKLYPIYKASYSDIFKNTLSKISFSNIILLDNIIKNDNKYINCEVNYIKEDVTKIERYIQSINIREIIKYIDVEKLQRIDNNSLKRTILCHYVINMIKPYSNFDIILRFINSSDEINRIIDDECEKIQASKDRERFLKGDFSIEEKIKRQELEYATIKDGYNFEKYVAKLYRKLGYRVEVTKKSGDQGADVIAYKDNLKYVIQAKFYNNPVGNKAVQEVVGAIGMYNADKGIVVTNSTFTKSAIELAKANNIELIDSNKIEILKKTILESSH